MVIDFSKIGAMREQPVLVLKNTDGTPIQTLGYAFGLNLEINYNEMSSIEFDIPKCVDGDETPHYDDIIGMRIIDMIGYGQFVLMNPKRKNDGVSEIKHCTAYSLEYELTYKKAFFEEGTYSLWNPVAPEKTVLGILVNELPSWTIGHVDESLIGKYRTFSEGSANIYNFIKSTVQQTYGCIVDFDTYRRTIYVRDVESQDNTSPVYLSMDNLAKEITIDENSENIVTVLSVYGADDLNIRAVNPLGTNKIYNLDYFMDGKHLPAEIEQAWNDWKITYEENRKPFYELSVERALKRAQILVKQNAIDEEKRNVLAQKENEQSIYIEHLSSLPSSNAAERALYQGKLTTVNGEINTILASLGDLGNEIEELEREYEDLTDRMAQIQDSVSLLKKDGIGAFTEDQYRVIDRYFKEDSLEDSSFVASDIISYSQKDIRTDLRDLSLRFSGAAKDQCTHCGNIQDVGFDYCVECGNETERISSPCTVTQIHSYKRNESAQEGDPEYIIDDSKIIYTIESGEIDCGFRGDVVKASFEKTDETFVLSAYVTNVVFNGTFLNSANISITGSCDDLVSDVVEDTETGGYATGSTLTIPITEAIMYFTANATEYQRQAVALDLYDFGVQKLKALAFPTYTFKVSSANFFSIDEFASFARNIELGQKIYLNIDDRVLEPILIGIKFDFENMDSMELTFSDSFSGDGSSIRLADILEQSISMGKTLETNKGSYNAFKSSGAATQVHEFIQSPLDIAKNAIMSSSNQAISWDGSGISMRKYIDDTNPDLGYEKEQMRLINNMLVMTRDGWNTVELAIGKIIDEKLTKYPETTDVTFSPTKQYYINTGDGYVIWDGTEEDWAERPTLYEEDSSAYGLIAKYLVGNILIGESLFISSQNNSFSVDSNGVVIDADKFFIRHSNDPTEKSFEEEILKISGDADSFVKKDTILTLADLEDAKENAVTGMSAAGGNVLFDKHGLWLMNSQNKETATSVILINENGIAFGYGDACPDPLDEDNDWSWPTVLNQAEVLSDSIAAGSITGMDIYGGTLRLGPEELGNGVTGYKFVVDDDGNVKMCGKKIGDHIDYGLEMDTYGNATFKGTIEAANFKGDLEALDRNTWIKGCGLEVKDSGGNVKFQVSPEGNVIMSGSITWAGGNTPTNAVYSTIEATKPQNNKEWSTFPENGTTSWHRIASTNDEYASYTYDGGATWSIAIKIKARDGRDGIDGQDGGGANLPEYIQQTYIDSATILSPSIYGGQFYATGQGRWNEAAYYIYDGFNSINYNTGYVSLGRKVGYLSFDSGGAGTSTESSDRVYLRTVNSTALKLHSSANMSLESDGGIISANSMLRLGDGLKGDQYVMWGSSLPSSPQFGQIFFKT